jgi:hypothetical protein
MRKIVLITFNISLFRRVGYNYLMETFTKSKWVSFKKDNVHPMRRWGHTSTVIGD